MARLMFTTVCPPGSAAVGWREQISDSGGSVECRLSAKPALPRAPGVCKLLHMATNLAIDDRLLDEALEMPCQTRSGADLHRAAV